MGIDLTKLKPTVISRDLKGKYMLLYGLPKSGKTSLATQFPNSLLLAFEKGYNALAGIMVQDVNTWVEMKAVLKDLRKTGVQDMFDTIIIDTAAIAWSKCEAYVCKQHDVSSIADVPWGRGYKICAKEFEDMFREITMLGYGLVFLTHSEEKPVPNSKEGEVFIAPLLEKRAYPIINGMVDIIACIDVDFKTNKRYLQMRSTPSIVAGCRFQYMPDRIELSYQSLVDNLVSAIEKQGAEKGVMVIDERIDLKETETKKTRPFSDSISEARELWTFILEHAKNEEAVANDLNKIVEENFNQKIKLSTVKESQQELLELTILDLIEYKSNLNK